MGYIKYFVKYLTIIICVLEINPKSLFGDPGRGEKCYYNSSIEFYNYRIL